MHGGRSSPAGRRRPQVHNPAHNLATEYADLSDHTRSLAAAQGTGHRNTYFHTYQSLNLGNDTQQQAHEMTGLSHPMYNQLGSMDPFTTYAGHHYAMLDPNAPSFSTSQRSASRPKQAERSPAQDWTGNFQSLALGGT